MKRETLALSFEEFDAFWIGFCTGEFADGIDIIVDGDLGFVFLVGLPH